MLSPFTNLDRLSLNQSTTQAWNLREAIEGCARAGVPWIGIWRDKLADAGLHNAEKWLRDAGLKVSGLCRGGMFPAPSAAERKARIEDNLRAIDEAATLQAEVLVLVCGASVDVEIRAAREMIRDGIGEILPYAVERGVKLGIEPLHPVFAGDRSAITMLSEANALIEQFNTPNLGVVVDVYHTWWDPNLEEQLAKAAGHILAYHVNDWLAPPPHPLLGRGMMGDGVIDLRRFRGLVEAAGYNGPIEVEIFNQQIWDSPPDDVLKLMCRRYLEYV
jgi:sugar phosphate isomerase/epimerase